MVQKKIRYQNIDDIFMESSTAEKKNKHIKLNTKIDFYNSKLCTKSDTNNFSSETLRQEKINCFNFPIQEIDKLLIPKLYLPTKFQKLSTLYKIILNVFNYNKTRKLNLIFEYHKSSIERIYKHEVTYKELQQLNYLLGKSIQFKKCIFDNIQSFNIIIHTEADIENIIYTYLLNEYKKWINKNISLINTDVITKPFHPDFNLDLIEIPQKHLFTNTIIKDNDMILLKNDNSNDNTIKSLKPSNIQNTLKCTKVEIQYNEILNKILAKEQLRKEQFIKNESIIIRYTDQLINIFNIEQKKAIRLSELVYRIGDFKAEENILKSLGTVFETKCINNEIYIVKKNN